MVNFDLPKVSKININFELLKISKMTSLEIYVSSHGEARNIKFRHQINSIERVPLGTPPQVVVMSLAHNRLTNLFISSYRGAAVIKFKQQKQLCGRRRQGTSLLVVATSLPFDHVTLINLYISSYREATGATFIHANGCHQLLVSNIL